MKLLKNYSLPVLILGGTLYLIIMMLSLPNPSVQQDNIAQPQEQDEMQAPEIAFVPSEENEETDLDLSIETIKIPPPIEGKEPIDYNQPQILPVEPLKIILAVGSEVNLEVEIAKVPKEHMTGMMFRKEVQQNTGMLFLFNEAEVKSFWMKNTFVPLDIIFIDRNGKILNIHSNAIPGDLSPIKSKGEALAVLEIGGGEAKRFGVQEGDMLKNASFEEIQRMIFESE
ncbi:MAG: DUF192 domain-containing protein [Alphaproteobacteria bacterium]|nr:DUF192 domain-containing protein [Alphaproteobacteria bacterium]